MILLPFIVAFLAGIAIERYAALPSTRGLSPAALPARIAAFALLAAFWLGVWDRPVLAAFACVVTLAVMTAISVMKRRLVDEPVVFSDFALLRLVVRHPDLYYTGFMATPPFLGGAAVFVAAVAAWLWAEPAWLAWWMALALVFAVLSVLALAWWVAALPGPARILARLVPEPAVEAHVGRWGLLLTVAAYALRWRGQAVDAPVAGIDLPAGLAEARPLAPDRVVVVQLESFVDPPRLWAGEPGLPGLARARGLALHHGPLGVPAHGAFTMRSEYAVLTGLSRAELGFRYLDPYLSTRDRAPPTLASRLAARGFATAFLHPFRAGFFDRVRVMPRLGFARLLYEEDFAGAERFGPYVSDAALVAHVLEEADRTGGPTLVVAVTMENHGPWSPGRLAHEPDPTRQYRLHLANADRAITTLIDALASRPERTLLCVFGDHPPILPGVVAAARPETDYAVLLLGGESRADAPTDARPLAAHELGRLLMRLSGVPGGTTAGTDPASRGLAG